MKKVIVANIVGSDLSRIRFFTRFLRAPAGGEIKKSVHIGTINRKKQEK